MNQRELNREIARATGETVSTIAGMGFVRLSLAPFERESDREPLVVDWDDLAAQREIHFPVY